MAETMLTIRQEERTAREQKNVASMISGLPLERLYVERFEGPCDYSTLKDVEQKLNAVREAHPKSSGWQEIDAYAKKLPNGRYKAVRWHYKIK